MTQVPHDVESRPGDALVIFGITGDLAKVMTLKALYDLTVNRTLEVPVIGVGRSDWGDEDLRRHAREAVEARLEAKHEELDEGAFQRYAEKLSYVQGDFDDANGAHPTPAVQIVVARGPGVTTACPLYTRGCHPAVSSS